MEQERRRLFWRRHLVGHFHVHSSAETMAFSATTLILESHGAFTPLGSPAAREFLKLASQGLDEVNPDGSVSYRFDAEDGEFWITTKKPNTHAEVPASDDWEQQELLDKQAWQQELQARKARDKEAMQLSETLRQDMLDAIAEGKSDCACALARELASMAKEARYLRRLDEALTFPGG